MSHSDEELAELVTRKRVLEIIKDALTKNITDKEALRTDFGLSEEEIEWFFTEVAGGERYSVSRLIPKIDKMLTNLSKQILSKLAERLSGLKIYLFGDWRGLTQARWTGLYRGRSVVEIEDSKVIILVAKEAVWRTITGEENILILGPGIYYAKFYLEGVSAPADYVRTIHGILMPKKLFEAAQTSPSRTYGKYADYYRRFLATVLLDFYHVMPREALGLRRLYVRIMNENKTVVEKFMAALRSGASIPLVEDDLEFLSLLPESFNRIIMMPDKFRRYEKEASEGIPGMMGFEGSLPKYKDLFATVSVGEILAQLKAAWTKFIKYGWDILIDLIPK